MRLPLAAFLLTVAGCGASGQSGGNAGMAVEDAARAAQPRTTFGKPFVTTAVATFDQPWAMTFVPGTPFHLVTEKGGRLLMAQGGAAARPVAGVPQVATGGQGGLGDVVVHPNFRQNRMVYLSYVEAGPGRTKGAVVGRGRLVTDAPGDPRLEGFAPIWRQSPKVTGNGHFGHRIAFGPDGMMYISSGEREKFTPAQDRAQNLGKILRLTDTGAVPRDNPFAAQGGVAAQIWTLGHRNPLGIAFDAQGRLWEQEMGPKGGDEVNLVVKGRNYGYPIVSNGDHYDGRVIPDHPTRPEFEAPKVSWNPVISPAGLMIYSGDLFPQWKGSAFIGGLSAQALIRVRLNGTQATKADQFPMGARIREVEQGSDGAIYVLEDGAKGRLLKLTPAA